MAAALKFAMERSEDQGVEVIDRRTEIDNCENNRGSKRRVIEINAITLRRHSDWKIELLSLEFVGFKDSENRICNFVA